VSGTFYDPDLTQTTVHQSNLYAQQEISAELLKPDKRLDLITPSFLAGELQE
jgi:hypothetical protein